MHQITIHWASEVGVRYVGGGGPGHTTYDIGDYTYENGWLLLHDAAKVDDEGNLTERVTEIAVPNHRVRCVEVK